MRDPIVVAPDCFTKLSFDSAQALLASHAAVLGVETVMLGYAAQRVLATAVRASTEVPRFDMSAMDGFAVQETDVQSDVRVFEIVGAVYPGDSAPPARGSGKAMRVMTGARIPSDAGRIVILEDVDEHDGRMFLRDRPGDSRHIRRRGSDITAGAVVLEPGRSLDARALVVAAAADCGTLQVWRQPRVHVVVNGDELVPPGQAAERASAVPDSLSCALLQFVHQWSGVSTGATLATDDISAVTTAAEAALSSNDILVIAGGASRGDRDFAKQALRQLGTEIIFENVEIKPGKPVWYGRQRNVHILGLPGNPTAAITIARLFLAPLLTALGGRGFDYARQWESAPLVNQLPRGSAREAFLCARLRSEGVEVLERQSASAQMMLAHADVLVRCPRFGAAKPSGALVELLRF